MESSLNVLPPKSTVYLLGRYSRDVKMLDTSVNFQLKYDNATNKTKVIYRNRKDLVISSMTVHSSKGLQADYVYLLNNRNKGMGFPSRIVNAPILKLLLDTTDNYPFAEERRLFYVALTRAKKKVFLLTVKGNEIVFCI